MRRVLVISAQLLIGVGCAAAPPELRLNHLQVVGSHNSYRRQPPPSVFAELRRINADWADTLEYSHLPLAQQFADQSVRQIELDVFADPAGGLFLNPRGLRLLGTEIQAHAPPLAEPGFKVLHIQDLDFFTTCLTFVDCLRQVKAWSDTHRDHAPIMILVEAKDDPQESLGVTRPVPFDAALFEALDAEIRSVFPPERMVTPDDVRGVFLTLDDAIRGRGWPTLASSRGRVLFALDNADPHRARYLRGHQSLRGRVMFTDSRPGQPEAAFAKLNDPIADGDEIRALVSRGFLVRTRADVGTAQARTGDGTMRDAALASGAHFVSTDYMSPNPAFGTGYRVTLPGGAPARCNPVSAPPGCQSSDIERARR